MKCRDTPWFAQCSTLGHNSSSETEEPGLCTNWNQSLAVTSWQKGQGKDFNLFSTVVTAQVLQSGWDPDQLITAREALTFRYHKWPPTAEIRLEFMFVLQWRACGTFHHHFYVLTALLKSCYIKTVKTLAENGQEKEKQLYFRSINTLRTETRRFQEQLKLSVKRTL